jgi:hypothetical protein
MREDFKDFQLRVVAMINDGGNSGVFFRQTPAVTYEAQINASSPTDPKRTGSLFILPARKPGVWAAVVSQSPAGPGQWFTLEILAEGNHITIAVNGKKTADYIDNDRYSSKGSISLQQQYPGSVVTFRKVQIKELAPGKQ